MRLVYIYSQHDYTSIKAIERIKSELGINFETVSCTEYEDVKDLYPLRALPAAIFIREDLQGEQLLSTDSQTASLRLVLEAAKAIEEEERNLQNAETNRLDNTFKVELRTQIEPVGASLVQAKIAQKKAEMRNSELEKELSKLRADVAQHQTVGEIR